MSLNKNEKSFVFENGRNRWNQVFDNGRSLTAVHKEIQEVYLSDERPWVVGYSGGKDSTATLQLVWNAIADLPPEMRKKSVYVITSDTLVENPVIVKYINQTIQRINEVAANKEMPFRAEKLKPPVTQSFWVNLIGRGYPAPQQSFRWCTDRLKIQPSNKFIIDKISRHGEVVLLLGVRSSESMTRAQVMNLYQIQGSILSRHSQFPRAYVYTPIKDFTLDDVWDYLLDISSPWGNNNRDLVALYKNATGECPLVVDEATPPCGGSRFGCWVCTLVTHDKSMEALVASSEGWMKPLLEIRDLLALTQDPELKKVYREYKRKQGMVSFKTDGSGIISRGPYKLDFCKEILTRVLKAQIEVRKNGPDPNIVLIFPEEIHEIRRIWRMERGDWEDSVPEIYHQTTGLNLEWTKDDLGTFSNKERLLLEETCKKHGVPVLLVMKLLDAEMQSQGIGRRSSIYSKIERVLREEWRTEGELLQELESRQSILENFKG